jgi:hypothetical protein
MGRLVTDIPDNVPDINCDFDRTVKTAAMTAPPFRPSVSGFVRTVSSFIHVLSSIKNKGEK